MRLRTPLLEACALGLTVSTGCGDDGSPVVDDPTTGQVASSDESGPETTGSPYVCMPGEIRCADLTSLERCAPTGKSWINEPCAEHTSCVPCDSDTCTVDACLGPCEIADDLPSSAGCSFIANRQLHLTEEFNDGLIVANPHDDISVTVQLFLTPEGQNLEDELESIVLGPLEAHPFQLTTNFLQTTVSRYRTGGTHRIQSDAPVIAYHHAPYALSLGNDSSLLFPESAAGMEYVVMSYAPYSTVVDGEPSYFEVVALANGTKLEWFPPVDTSGDGLPIPFVPAGGSGQLSVNRFDTIRITASANQQDVLELRDVSGTVVRADKPIWVTSGTRCSRVPVLDPEMYPIGHCDPLQEQPIPLQYWGNEYVAVHSPARETERHWWRIFGGTDGVTVSADIDVPGLPVTFAKRGDYIDVDVPNSTSFVLTSEDGVFMPVQYLQGQRWDGASPEPVEESTVLGDPSMYQMVPVDQFLNRYLFSTALNFARNYVQVIRTVGGADVVLDGTTIPGGDFYTVGDYEVADVEIEEGTYLIESADPFGIIQVGYSLDTIDPACLLDEAFLDENGEVARPCPSSYAYPGGMKSIPIYIP